MEIFKTCCFTGHRSIPVESLGIVATSTADKIERLVQGGFDTFICGGAVGYDMLCGKTVLNLKKKYEHIKLVMALPCRDQSKFFGYEDKKTYQTLIMSADKVVCLSEYYYSGCMHERNRYMVDNSAVVIAYCIKQSGGTYYTCKYAKEKGKRIILAV